MSATTPACVEGVIATPPPTGHDRGQQRDRAAPPWPSAACAGGRRAPQHACAQGRARVATRIRARRGGRSRYDCSPSEAPSDAGPDELAKGQSGPDLSRRSADAGTRQKPAPPSSGNRRES
jgi:hypothetical protein